MCKEKNQHLFFCTEITYIFPSILHPQITKILHFKMIEGKSSCVHHKLSMKLKKPASFQAFWLYEELPWPRAAFLNASRLMP